ncbi:MAG TPA: hypothetical protein PK331_00945 [Gordonia sp. (in: high G+C Gram-positive bacteria)]|uniref:hypothetical protein n=1 Tax=Gordonia sp. (in: high G+C Gram-positive bacteria) TaxID=84139 RepID=UPI00262828D6|nr:hypothetical protein [Gordonia sp. (in: high G+C Gram-positive bacteria)]HNP55740.1 hypothetical protein [Gordonia sp. (in: high G+C Gram-positive bacteria)]HRC49476.1 hypothetical protein [Gordonia sp. (in: high G+C Gram-positive bacteria)]
MALPERIPPGSVASVEDVQVTVGGRLTRTRRTCAGVGVDQAELERRAREAGMSVSKYTRRLIEAHLARPAG